MKKILLFSRDPGGANTVTPLVKPLMARGYELALWGKDIALKKYQEVGLQGQDIMDVIGQVNVESLRDFLSSQVPDLVITGTSAEDFCEKYMWKAAEELGIVSFAILDQWLFYGIRFSDYPFSHIHEFLKKKEYIYLPSRIFIMDELAQQDALTEGLPAGRLFVTGQPHLQVLIEKERSSKEEIASIRKALGVTDKDTLIVFASEPITETFGTEISSLGYTEGTILKDLLEELREITPEVKEKIILIIRPHPREQREKFDQLENLSSQGFKVIVSTDHDSDKLIEAADCICGMSSMFLLESALLGKPIISIQIGLRGESLFVLDRNNIVKSVRDRESLGGQLRKIIIDKEFKQPTLSFIKDPISRIVVQVDEYFDQK